MIIILAIGILNYKTYEKTIECVESIISTCKQDFEIFIIDNNSPNESMKVLREKYNEDSKIFLIENKSNEGFARGNQKLLKFIEAKNKHEYIVISNNDIIFLEDSIQQLIDPLISNENAVIVGPKIYSLNGDVQESSRSEHVNWLEGYGLYSVYNLLNKKKYDRDVKKIIKVTSVSGCCFAVNKKNFRKIGYFDTNTFLFYEENILAFKAEEKLFETYFNPKSKIIHAHGATTGKENLFTETELIKSSIYYWKNYRSSKAFFIIGMILSNFLKNNIKYFIFRSIEGDIKKYWKDNKLLLFKS